MRGTDIHAAGEGYATGDELQIEGDEHQVTVTSTALQLTDDVSVSGDGYSVAEQLTITDPTGWEEPPVIEVTTVDDTGRVTGLEMRSGGVYKGELPDTSAGLFFKPVESESDSYSYGSGGGSYDNVDVAEPPIATNASAGLEPPMELSAISQQTQAGQQQQQRQQQTSPVLVAAAACGLAVVAALVSWRQRFTKSTAQQVAGVGSTPCAATATSSV
jgi:hypothetical protein